MPVLYDISFTTKMLISKYDSKGKVIGTSQMDKPVTMTMLPYSTAMSYKEKCDNFTIKRSEFTDRPRRKSAGSGSNEWGAPATKSAERDKYERKAKENKRKTKIAETPKANGVSKAATTGDLGAAIND